MDASCALRAGSSKSRHPRSAANKINFSTKIPKCVNFAKEKRTTKECYVVKKGSMFNTIKMESLLV